MSKHFNIQELTPPGFNDWKYIKEPLIDTIEELRELIGKPMLINYGDKHLRGYRPKDCKVGAPNSLHKKGLAADFNVFGIDCDLIRDYIRSWKKEGKLKYLESIELDISWVHIGCSMTPVKILREFKP